MLLLLFGLSDMSHSLQSHGLQHAMPLYPSPSPKVCPSSCPLHQWCHPAISSSDIPFSFCPQSFPTSGTLPMSWLYRIVFGCTRWLKYWIFNFGISPFNEYSALISLKIDWFQFPCCPRDSSQVFSSTIVGRYQFFITPPSLWSCSS